MSRPRIAAVTIGQTPRPDLLEPLLARAGTDIEVIEIGALDGLTPGAAVRCFYEAYAKREGKPRWGEKTPAYVTKMRLIERALPEARFIHVIRDGRDVTLSVLDRTVRDYTAGDIARRWQRKIEKARAIEPKLSHYIEVRY